jgi:hypothetical protein
MNLKLFQWSRMWNWPTHEYFNQKAWISIILVIGRLLSHQITHASQIRSHSKCYPSVIQSGKVASFFINFETPLPISLLFRKRSASFSRKKSFSLVERGLVRGLGDSGGENKKTKLLGKNPSLFFLDLLCYFFNQLWTTFVRVQSRYTRFRLISLFLL